MENIGNSQDFNKIFEGFIKDFSQAFSEENEEGPQSEEQEKNPLKNIAINFREFLEKVGKEVNVENIVNSVADDETKNFLKDQGLNKFFSSFDNNTPLVMLYKQIEKQKQELEKQIANMDENERKKFWAQYHDISQEDTNTKLDAILNAITVLNSNVINNSNLEEKIEDVIMEIQILRKELRDKN